MEIQQNVSTPPKARKSFFRWKIALLKGMLIGVVSLYIGGQIALAVFEAFLNPFRGQSPVTTSEVMEVVSGVFALLCFAVFVGLADSKDKG